MPPPPTFLYSPVDFLYIFFFLTGLLCCTFLSCSVFLSYCCVLLVIFLIENCEIVIKEEGEKGPVKSDCESDTEEAEEELVLEHPGQLCRLCASAVSEAVYIFGATGKEQRIAEKINSCLPVMVSYLHCTSVVIQNSRFVVYHVTC